MIKLSSPRVLMSVLAAFLFITAIAVPVSAAEDGIDGYITNAKTGAPIPRAWVAFYDSSGTYWGGASANEAGYYDVTLPAGQYRLHAGANEYHDKRSDDLVTSPGTVPVTLSPIEYGAIVGTFVRTTSAPVANALVELKDVNENDRGSTNTDAAGNFRFDRLRAGDYKIRFTWPGNAWQWYPGETYSSRAGIVTVTGSQETVVQETALPVGGLVATITDDASGAPMPGVCLHGNISSDPAFASACTDSAGRADFGLVRAGTWRIIINAPPGYLFETIEEVVVPTEQTGHGAATLKKEAVIEATFEDAVTGAPVADACVVLVDDKARNVVSDPYTPNCSHGTGKIRLDRYFPGRQRIYVRPGDSVHGSQWVGADGGTGDVEQAKWFELKHGVTTHVRVRLDVAGAITGVVTDAITGRPVSRLCPMVTPAGPSGPNWAGVSCTDAEGRYIIHGVGPYDWRVQFPDYSERYAWQWSGGARDRLAASPVRVRSGVTTTLDAKLQPAAKVVGKIIGATMPVQFISVRAVNARTGDWAAPDGFVNLKHEYTLANMGTQLIKITYSQGRGEHWYPRPVPVVAGRTTTGVDLHMPNG